MLNNGIYSSSGLNGKNCLLFNSLLNFGGSGLPLIIAFLAIPYLLKNLGDERFGILTLIWTLIGFTNIFDLGISKALTVEIGKNLSAKPEKFSRIIATGLALAFLFGVFGAFFVGLIAKPLAFSWLGIGHEFRVEAHRSFFICAFGIIPTVLTSGIRGVFEGFGLFLHSNILRLAIGIPLILMPALSVAFWGPNLEIISLFLFFFRLLVCILSLFMLIKICKLDFFSPEKDVAKLLIKFGFWLTITGIVGPIMVYGDRFFVSAIVGAQLLPVYSIPQEALQRLLLIPLSICGALLPIMSKANHPHELSRCYYKNLNRITLGMGGISILVIVNSSWVLPLWLGNQLSKEAYPISAILCIGIFLNSIANIPYNLLHSQGNTKLTAIFHLFELFLYFLILNRLVTSSGLIGAAAAWTIRAGIDLLLLLIAAKKVLSQKILLHGPSSAGTDPSGKP